MNWAISLRLGALALCAAALSTCGESTDEPVTRTHDLAAGQIARGRYLAKAAVCAACHTIAGGAPFAGGVKLASPFGTFYGMNITPDPVHCIGRWSAEQFYKALHDGVAPDKQLYPAMPYTSYRTMSRADSDAIYDYLMAQKPAAVPNREPDLTFPFNMRFAVKFWNMLFLKDALPDASTGNSADRTRGRYLANALGHCAECHTPRGVFGQMNGAKALRGSTLGRVVPPDITPAGLAARGCNGTDLQTFFATGISRQGSAFGEMHPVVVLSSQYLTRSDLRAMSTYLLGDAPLLPTPVQPGSADAAQLAAGRTSYVAVCAGCHGREGEGKPHVAVSMQGNSTLRQANPHNLIVAMLDGVDAADFAGTESMQAMPGFAATLSDDELAHLANYLRAGWGGQPGDVTAANVKALR
ncbi:c-type cytochrome [Caballeronia sp. SEWSISQ10-4 2]|uniref:c-type cytochrome n=1 Tax=Caballeronia sp. SEWSISQ10-4 2 TaxID=2937438 RepID=UPI00264BF017|nr:cytochrome c [Caballeronia sp. SEWSISQ10-4 2]MDN7178867.1 c-type cytochrome [Caballeronia sp. SEWSISQ10-4 2]